jgi:DnaJ-class molecular chaperone
VFRNESNLNQLYLFFIIAFDIMSSTNLYEILGIQKNAEVGDIKKSFMKLAKTHHPDKGGDVEEFKKIQHAYEILSDENKRQVYDLTGQIPDDNVSSRGPPSGFPGFSFDIGSLFGMFGAHMNGGGGPDGRRKRAGKPPAKIERIRLNMDQFYHGHSFQVFIDRHRFCTTCNGDGSKKKEQCVACHGSGNQSQVINMNGMSLHSRGPCIVCMGVGYKTTEKCSECNATGKISEKKKLEANILPGMRTGETFVFQGACSETAEYEQAGDLHIIVEQSEDENGWKRTGQNGQNLEMIVHINLSESLVGCVVRLDGHPGYDDGLFIKIPPASFTNDTYCISGLGMPIRGETNSYGDLHIKIQVSVKLSDRRLLASDAAQTGLEALFGANRRSEEGYESGKTDVQTNVFLIKS